MRAAGTSLLKRSGNQADKQKAKLFTPPTWRAPGTSAECSSDDVHACPCGYYGDTTRECRCTGAIVQRYLGKVRGPLLDRIDLHVEVPAVAHKELRIPGQADHDSAMMPITIPR